MLVQRGLLRRLGTVLRQIVPSGSRVFVLTAPPIRRHYGGVVRKSLEQAGYRTELLEMPDGERAKTLAHLEITAGKLLRRGADRNSVLLALGGGVVGDVGGFLASIFMRGIPVVQIPTTLLAQVDSAIGGKTGVNLKAGKNLLGTFHQPLMVLTDPDVLTTLPERQFRSGLFEAMKYGVIRKNAIFELMEFRSKALLGRDSKLLEKLIAACVAVKADVVSGDEREGGERRILNFGHTIGHALEAETRYRHFLHGEAVGWGMIAATLIAGTLQLADAATSQRILSLVHAYGPLPSVHVDARKIVQRLAADKKTVNGVTHFILPTAVGKVEVVNNVPAMTVVQAVKEIKYLSKA